MMDCTAHIGGPPCEGCPDPTPADPRWDALYEAHKEARRGR